MADNDPKTNEGPGKEYVPKAFIILFGVLLLAGAGALLYCLYTACPVCEPPESAAGVAPRATAGTPQPSPSPSPGVAASPTPVPELKLIAFAPDSGSVMGGNLVRLDGIGLNNVKEVRFGGLPATLVGSPNPTSLTVKPPAHVEGRVDVIVSDGQSRDTGPAFYTYVCPPLAGKDVIWLMVLVGALGGIIHALQSFYCYVGNRQLVWSWIPMYFFRPFIGAGISTVFYLIIRGGLMSGVAEHNSVFGLMAIGTLVGIFSPQALEKLKNVSEIIFNKPEVNEHGEDRLFPKESEKPPLEVEKVMPSEGQENQPVTILGKGFVKGKVRVRFGDKAAKVAKVEDEEITVTTPDHPPGKVKVVVIQEGASLEAPGGFTYKNAGPPPENKPEDKDE
jgi:IPT/TIG domain-containing protein